MKGQKPLTNPFGISDPFEYTKVKQVDQTHANIPQQTQTTVKQTSPFQKHQEFTIHQDEDDLSGNIALQQQRQPKVQNQWEDYPQQDTSQKGYTSFDENGDPPLLEDLDITNPKVIKKRVMNVLFLKTFDEEYLENPDLSGPILLGLLLGFLLMLAGKLHFNYIYGFGAAGWIFVFFIMNFMSQDKFIDFYKIVSILGYGLAPVVFCSFINIFISLKGSFALVLPFASILWSTVSAAKTFDFALGLEHRRLLIAYPIFLFYFTFILITIF